MGRSAAAIALFVVLLAASSASARASSLEDAVRASTVLVIGMIGDHPAVGSGVIVEARPERLTILTAKHVAMLQAPDVIASDGRRLDVIDVNVIPGFDLAVIHAVFAQHAQFDPPEGRHMLFTEVQTSYLPLYPAAVLAASSSLVADEPVFVWGYAGRSGLGIVHGTILSTDPALPDGPANGRFAIRCADCRPGMSGAGVFTESGKLVGILSAAWKTPDGIVRMIEVEPLTPVTAAAL